MKAVAIVLYFVAMSSASANDTTLVYNSGFKRFHISLGYGKSRFNQRSNVIGAYRASGLPHAVISTSDASPRVELPLALTAGIEYEALRNFRIGLNYSYFTNQSIRGSNWIGEQWQQAPAERFDALQKTSGASVALYVDYVFLPVHHGENRWEGSFGAGLSINKQKMTGRQDFMYCPTYSVCTLDSFSTYGAKAIVPGAQMQASLDFYWTPWLSTQARLEFRLMPELKVKENTMTFLTSRRPSPLQPPVLVEDTHTIGAHSINFSGSTFSLWFRFHF